MEITEPKSAVNETSVQKKSKILVFLVLFALPLSLLLNLFFIYQIQKNKEQNKQTSVGKVKPTPSIASKQIEQIGFIRTSGLRTEEKARLNLKFSDYQLTDFTPPDQINKVYGYYIENPFNGDALVGKCVKMKIKTVNNWDAQKINQAYNRIPVISLGTKILNIDTCLSYFDQQNENEKDPQSFIEKLAQNYQRVKLSGRLQRATRPAPDIGYDYALLFNEPQSGFAEAAGSDIKVDSAVVVPYTIEIRKMIEANIGKMVNAEGYIEWGYSEGQYFGIISLEITESNRF